jgi:transcriptional regulator GlxA family with amidase domain
MRVDPRVEVERLHPYGSISPRRIVPIPVDAVHPVIRIAHRMQGPLRIPERIIVDHELVMILSGRGELQVGRRTISFDPHTLFFIQPFVPHSFNASDTQSGEHLAVHFDFAPNTPAQDEELSDRNPYEVRLSSGLEIPVKTSLTAGHRIERALLEVLKERESGEPTGRLAAVAYLTEVLVQLLRLEPNDKPESVSLSQRLKITRAMQYVDDHLAEPMSAQHLADAADLSISRFNTIFRLETGYSPADFIRRRRIDEARKLLAEPDLSVKEIAARTGFEDSFHFSKVFRKIDGLSPTRYREAVLPGRHR